MYFYMPVKIYSEKNAVSNHAGELAALGSRALIVTGRRSSRTNGSLMDVQRALEGEGIPYEVFDRIEENPSVENVMEARRTGLEAGADFVIGIGGGSPMDAAKAVALLMRQRDAGEECLYQKGDDSALPVAEIPTTCGTGSEATPYAILTVHTRRTKASISHRVFPALSLCDPGYLSSAGREVLCSTAVDALGHFAESYINSNATQYSRMLCEKGLKLWSSAMDVLTWERQAVWTDYENLMNASTLAGMAITHTGTSLPHGLSYYLTYQDGVPHGKAVGVFLPGYVKAAREEDRRAFLSLMGLANMDEFTALIRRTCRDIQISADLRREAAEGMMGNEAKLVNCPYPVSRKTLEDIFREFFG